jgi:hypothetical protein
MSKPELALIALIVPVDAVDGLELPEGTYYWADVLEAGKRTRTHMRALGIAVTYALWKTLEAEGLSDDRAPGKMLDS